MKKMLCMGMFLAVSATAFAQDVKLYSSNQTVRLFGNKAGVMTDFVKNQTTNTYEIRVIMQDKTGRNVISNKSVTFSPVAGKFVRNDQDLYYKIENEEILVAHHEWYYSPFWKVIPGVSLKTLVKKLNLNDYKIDVNLSL